MMELSSGTTPLDSTRSETHARCQKASVEKGCPLPDAAGVPPGAFPLGNSSSNQVNISTVGIRDSGCSRYRFALSAQTRDRASPSRVRHTGRLPPPPMNGAFARFWAGGFATGQRGRTEVRQIGTGKGTFVRVARSKWDKVGKGAFPWRIKTLQPSQAESSRTF